MFSRTGRGKRASIERRIRRTVLGAVMLTLAVTVTSVLVANERLEMAILERDMQAERDFLLGLTDPDQPLLWQTADMQGFYLPQAWVARAAADRSAVLHPDLPDIFRNRPFPFAEEVEIGADTFMVTAVQTAHGRLYLAKDITLFEQQEGAFERFLVVLCVVMLSVALWLARLTSRRLAAPLTQLSRHMAHTEPAATMPRVSVTAADEELVAIAQSFNRFLTEIEQYVRREKSLLGMASHELRTPIAIIAGALDGIEQRDQIAAGDVRALARIRQAVDEMGANVDAILKLTRREVRPLTQVNLTRILSEILTHFVNGAEDAGQANPSSPSRIRLHVQAEPVLLADAVLVRMLVRNLLHNALQHTPGHIDVRLAQHWLEIEDEGAGLPLHYRDYLLGRRQDAETDEAAHVNVNASASARHSNSTHTTATATSPSPGLGLFIVTLLCERLGWQVQLRDAARAGSTCLRLNFGATTDADTHP